MVMGNHLKLERIRIANFLKYNSSCVKLARDYMYSNDNHADLHLHTACVWG